MGVKMLLQTFQSFENQSYAIDPIFSESISLIKQINFQTLHQSHHEFSSSGAPPYPPTMHFHTLPYIVVFDRRLLHRRNVALLKTERCRRFQSALQLLHGPKFSRESDFPNKASGCQDRFFLQRAEQAHHHRQIGRRIEHLNASHCVDEHIVVTHCDPFFRF